MYCSRVPTVCIALGFPKPAIEWTWNKENISNLQVRSTKPSEILFWIYEYIYKERETERDREREAKRERERKRKNEREEE